MRKVLFFAFILIFSANSFAQTAPTAAAVSASKTDFDLTDYGVRIEPDRRLITVLASLEAAGVDTPLSARGAKFRERVQSDVQSVNLDLRQKIKIFLDRYTNRYAEKYRQGLDEAERKKFDEFFKQYKEGFKNEDEKKIAQEKYKSFYNGLVAPFVSMAYSLSPVPELSDPLRTTDLPGDLLEVLDYAPLAREFYRRITGAKIDEYAKIYLDESLDLRRAAVDMVGDLLDYLHTKPQISYIESVKVRSSNAKGKKTLEQTELRRHARRFFIVPEMLAPTGAVNFLNIGDDYFAVTPPSTDLSQSEVRRAYLQFTLDPLILNNAKELSASSDAIKKLLADLKLTLFEREKATNKNAGLEDIYVSPDVFLAVSRSLVAAADARQIEFTKSQIATAQARRTIDATQGAEEKRKVSAQLDVYKKSLADETALQLSDAYEKGAVLAFYFADQLKGLENSGFDIASSFHEMILSLDLTKEANRYAQFAEARTRAMAAREARRNSSGETVAVIENPTTKRLIEIENIIQAKNFSQADAELKKLLAANPQDAPRIYYAIGRNASLSAEQIADVDARNRRLLEAKTAYENVLRSASADTDRAFISLAYVALGRLYEYDSENEYAVKIYEAAIQVGDVPGGAYLEAVAARLRLLKKQ